MECFEAAEHRLTGERGEIIEEKGKIILEKREIIEVKVIWLVIRIIFLFLNQSVNFDSPMDWNLKVLFDKF